ncbi:MAG TPA: hypothetical protein VG074_15025 [Acidimicrobiales bacterium]|jgi:hypothetical protein|nr:hypothetical protein [Acidimicrobiales bacterium]
MTGLLGAFFVEVALVTFRSVSQGGLKVPATAPIPAPLPSLYTSVILVYGGLSLAPRSVAPLATLIGWGFVVATFLNLYTPGSANAAAAANAQLAANLGPPVAKTPVLPPTAQTVNPLGGSNLIRPGTQG